MFKRIYNNRFILVFCLLIFVASCSQTLAKTTSDSDKKGSLIIEYLLNKSVEGIEFKLYKIADLDENSNYNFVNEFKKYEKHLCLPKKDSLEECASAFASFAKRDKLKAVASAKTDKDNLLSFKDLDLGIYLVTAESIKMDNMIYRHKPYIVFIPNFSNGKVIYDLHEYSNYTFGKINSKKKIYRKALIVWEDEDFERNRPESVEIQLLRDGKLYSTVSLSEDNNWRYRFGPLSSLFEWSIVQKDIPESYMFTMARKGRTFVLKNKYIDCDVCDINNTNLENDIDIGCLNLNQTLTEAFPRTGLLWWPVPILVCVGVLLFAVGVFKNIKEA